MAKQQTTNPPQSDSTDWLAELDRMYVSWREVERVAIWGGSWEREHHAQQELKGKANEMLDAPLKLLAARHSDNAEVSREPGK